MLSMAPLGGAGFGSARIGETFSTGMQGGRPSFDVGDEGESRPDLRPAAVKSLLPSPTPPGSGSPPGIPPAAAPAVPQAPGIAPSLLAPRGPIASLPAQPGGAPPAAQVTDLGELSATVNTGYFRQLAAFAVALEAQAKGRCEPAAIRMLRERLTQWIEDLRSVGGNRELAAAVEALVVRLSAVLAAPANLAAEVAAIADALAKLASGEPPPPEKKKSRLAFWK